MRKFIELLSIPLLVVPVTLITLWLISGSSEASHRWFLVFLLNIVFLPTIVVFWLERHKFISDLDLKKKSERLAFLAIMVVLSLINYFDSLILLAPKTIQALNLLAFSLILSLALVTLFWKISGHAFVLISIILVATFLKGNQALWVLLILPLIASHRLYFGHHNLTQIIAGILLGAFLTLTVLTLSRV